jgi:choline dehydrogenase
MPTHDYVIIGAGSAGCVLANRLSAGGCSVLLLEAGGSDRKLPVKAPAAFPMQFQTPIDWCYSSEAEPGLFGRRLMLPRGKMVGGTSSMNAMFYVRGNRADYDAWAEQYGATGWSYAEVLPYFRRSEDNQDFNDRYHGSGGELHVSKDRWVSHHFEAFAAAAERLGIKRNPDYNGEAQDGVSEIQTTTKKGRRWSAADAFLRPALGRDNLKLLTGALVHRITLERGRATGVDYEREGKRERATTRCEVILAAGSYGSPQLLMLSGIGPADHLREVGVEAVVDAPGVGGNLQEHPFALFNWRSTDPVTLDDAAQPKHLARWVLTRTGKLTSVIGEGVIHWRSTDGLAAPDFQIYFAPVFFWQHGLSKSNQPCITLGCSLQAPESRGTVRLRSDKAADPPRILNNLLTADADVEAMLRGIDFVRELAQTAPLSGLLGERLNPGETIVERHQLVNWLRAECQHIYHPAGTCRIGPPGEGVVAPDLKLYGIEGLRVCDASVIPRITSGNTNAPTYMIAERGADLILGEQPQVPADTTEPAPVTTVA